jgi:hypothetical protein
MRERSIFEPIDQRIHEPTCLCRECHPRMPGEAITWAPTTRWAAAIILCGLAGIIINYLQFA